MEWEVRGNYGLFHMQVVGFSRSFTLLRTDQGRNSAIFTLFQVRAIFRKKEKLRRAGMAGTDFLTEQKAWGTMETGRWEMRTMDTGAKNTFVRPDGFKERNFFLEISRLGHLKNREVPCTQ